MGKTTTSFILPNTKSNVALTKTFMAGFGSTSSTGGNKKSKKNKSSSAPIKLKPKLQWDRYLSFKDSSIITVAVQKIDTNDAVVGEWINVGYVKSLNNEVIDIAVARQRALIA